MANLTITATSVVKGANAVIDKDGTCGETLTAGLPVHKSSSDGLYYKSDVNDTSHYYCDGVCLIGGAANQPCWVQLGGQVTIGATVAIGTYYCVSRTVGLICPIADMVSGDYPIGLGFAVTAAIIELRINRSGVAVP